MSCIYSGSEAGHTFFIDISDKSKPQNALEHNASSAVDGKVERVRHSLSFCLAIDYNLASETPDRLSVEDFCHFNNLARRCFQSEGGNPPLIRACTGYMNYLRPNDISLSDPVIEMEFLQPVRALGIPCSVSIAMLRMLISAITFWGVAYNSQMSPLAGETSLDNLSAKIFMERQMLFDILLPPSDTAFRDIFEVRATQELRGWFKALRGPADYDENVRGRLAREFGERHVEYLSALPWGARWREYDCARSKRMVRSIGAPAAGDSLLIKFMRRWIEPRKGGLVVDGDHVDGGE